MRIYSAGLQTLLGYNVRLRSSPTFNVNADPDPKLVFHFNVDTKMMWRVFAV
jgi:hypothetical protein